MSNNTGEKLSFAQRLAQTPFFRFFVKNETAGMLVLKLVIMIAIPVAWPFIAGLIFDYALKLYSATTAIFVILVIFYALSLFMIIFAIIYFAKYRGTVSGKKDKTSTDNPYGNTNNTHYTKNEKNSDNAKGSDPAYRKNTGSSNNKYANK